MYFVIKNKCGFCYYYQKMSHNLKSLGLLTTMFSCWTEDFLQVATWHLRPSCWFSTPSIISPLSLGICFHQHFLKAAAMILEVKWAQKLCEQSYRRFHIIRQRWLPNLLTLIFRGQDSWPHSDSWEWFCLGLSLPAHFFKLSKTVECCPQPPYLTLSWLSIKNQYRLSNIIKNVLYKSPFLSVPSSII